MPHSIPKNRPIFIFLFQKTHSGNRAQAPAFPSTATTYPCNHTSAQPPVSNTEAYRHKSTPSRTPQPKHSSKKARGVCRGAAALRPLCGFLHSCQQCLKLPFHFILASISRNKHTIPLLHFYAFIPGLHFPSAVQDKQTCK